MNSGPGQLDESLKSHAEALARGRVEALGEIFLLAGSHLLRYALFLLNDVNEAEDLVQQSLLKLARKPRQLKRAQAPFAYLMRMVRNEAYTVLSRKKVHAREHLTEDLPSRSTIPVDFWEIAESVHAAMRTLPLDQMEVVTLRIWEGMTFREIAEVMGESQNTIVSRYRSGLMKLEQKLKAQNPHADLNTIAKGVTIGLDSIE